MPNKLLIIDDDVDLCHLLSRYLFKKGYVTETAFSGNKGIAKYKTGDFDAVIADYRLGDMDGIQLIRELKQINSKVAILIITGYSDIRPAIEVTRLGAFDYIPKPLVPEEVLEILKKMLNREYSGEQAALPQNEAILFEQDYYIGTSDATADLYQQVNVVAPTNYSVVLYGESGTGKEVIARTIHQNSKRSKQPFVAIDCGTLSRELAGSELFGHVKGAFTGALQDKEGHFEMANGGTLFLDEIANLSSDIQAILLRIIQERKFKRVGGNREIGSDVRIIVASNENLKAACQKGKFREDLYHRLNEFAIHLPALRDRPDEIRPLATFFLKKCCEESEKKINGFSEHVFAAFQRYDWPGNLRELRNAVRRAVLLTPPGGTITEETLLPEIITHTPVPDNVLTQDPAPMASAVSPTQDLLKDVAGRAEYQAIMNVLQRVNFNKKKAAEMLNIDRKTLYNKLKQFQGVN
ncbi:sigma-54-dependent Fis family transcriptional regulator [Niabella ginsenosidivorans]|uniref:Sigma-54-dependent Fis family transcriptional regulator n=1 Tax=Niabella ginsenosidivorans TaxID=1176587 RepID=A0A1A9I5B9_9BACT|nr:sigma-54 dependent transcriptional regulator [Niabella ginsenosidivorans]ANH81882.1 sigma-54-dependent Fis family transcriptional regulator [Niabella ginsenosidivorans]